MYDTERWNLSPERLYQECWIRWLLRETIDPADCARVCNVGVGLGELDDFLGYWLLGHGRLVSVDIDEQQILDLRARQAAQRHPNPSEAVHADLMVADLGPFDLVTIVGSTLHETHVPAAAVRRAWGWVRPGGLLYATVVHDLGDPHRIIQEIRGVFLQRTFDALPGAEITAVLARRPEAP